jgi:FG-GAP repeat.
MDSLKNQILEQNWGSLESKFHMSFLDINNDGYLDLLVGLVDRGILKDRFGNVTLLLIFMIL